MAHRVFLHVEAASLELGRRDIVFWIRDRETDTLIGELRISRGAVVWRGKSDQFGRKIRWERFDALMQQHGRRAELRPHDRRRPAR